MLNKSQLQPKQVAAVKRLFEYDETLLVAPTGAGKTVICLTTVAELKEGGHLSRVIVACPAKLLVTKVWSKEVKKWEHLSGLTVVELEGDPDTRRALLEKPADVIVVSLQNLDWLLAQKHGADGIIIDELSKGAGKQTAGLKSKKKAGMLGWRVGMTATPVSQNFEKLFNMCRILSPHYLGTNKQKYLDQYFYSDYQGYNWTLRDGADAQIMAQVAPLVHLVEDTKANDLPALHQHVIRFEMPAETRAIYNQMKKDMVVGDVEAANEAVKSGKLRQIASGFMYNDEGGCNIFDDVFDCARTLLMQQWVFQLSVQKRRGVIFYEYKQQFDDIFQLAGMTDSTNDFLKGQGNFLVAQVNSLSHGVDGLQNVCSDILFYHPMWSRDATEQAIGRVWRTGQTKEVNVTTLVCDDTLDDLVMDRVEDRGEWMVKFKQHLEKG
jgi:SNF2 family DNA or RNA helicase